MPVFSGYFFHLCLLTGAQIRASKISLPDHIVLYFFNQTASCVFFVPGTWRAVEIELIIARGSQAAHLKYGVPIFQNLQQK